MSNNESNYDIRIVDMKIKEGKLSEKEYKSFVKKLEDVTDKSQTLVIEEEITEEHENDEEFEESGDEEE